MLSRDSVLVSLLKQFVASDAAGKESQCIRYGSGDVFSASVNYCHGTLVETGVNFLPRRTRCE
jgi:hypothetical protein